MGSTEVAEQAWTTIDAFQLIPEIEWPAPWRPVDIQKEYGDNAVLQDELLETAVGASELKIEAEQVSQNTSLAESVTQHSWWIFQNDETEQLVLLRTITACDPKTNLIRPVISAVIFFYNKDSHIFAKSIDTRNFPMAKFEEAFYIQFLSRLIAIKRTALAVGCYLDEGKSRKNWKPSEPLKDRNLKSNTFLAQVATQYEWLQKQYPNENIVDMMSQLNKASVKTVQKWLTLARKAELLLPTHRGRKTKDYNKQKMKFKS